MQYERLQLDLSTPERVYNAVLIRTGDKKRAEQALVDSRMNDKLEQLKQQKV